MNRVTTKFLKINYWTLPLPATKIILRRRRTTAAYFRAIHPQHHKKAALIFYRSLDRVLAFGFVRVRASVLCARCTTLSCQEVRLSAFPFAFAIVQRTHTCDSTTLSSEQQPNAD
eukprot:scaffold9190_cov81-Skeletonema_dohrnii-CCMP3373.AAC.3